MAAKLKQVFCKTSGIASSLRLNPGISVHQTRCLSQTATNIPGLIPPEPLKKKFSAPIVLLCIGLGGYVGQYLAKSVAGFLEETEMFIPDDDDD